MPEQVKKSKSQSNILQIITVSCVIALIILQLLVLANTTKKSEPKKQTVKLEQMKDLAQELRKEALYEQAIQSYEEYLKTDVSITPEQRANIYYLIGEMYMDGLSDYENAMASFLKVKLFCPTSEAVSEANKRIVNCLDHLGRSFDAQRKLDSLTRLDEKSAPDETDTSTVIAKVGDKNITMRMIEKEIESLPEYMRSQYKEPEKKAEFLQQYVVNELLYNTAERKGYDRDKEVLDQMYKMKKSLMAQKVYTEEIINKIKMKEAELKLYYKEHPDEFIEKEKRSVSRLFLNSEKDAKEALNKLNNGSDFINLVKELSVDSKGDNDDGSIGYLTKDSSSIPTIGNDLNAIKKIFETEQGKYTDPIKIGSKWYIFKIDEIVPDKTKSYEDCKSEIEYKLKRQKEEQAQQEFLQQMVKDQKVAIYSDLLEKN